MPIQLKPSSRTQFPDGLNNPGLLPGDCVPCRVKASSGINQSARLKTDLQIAARVSTTSWHGWLALLILPVISILFRKRMPAWLFMWTLSFAIFAGLKWITFWRGRTRVAANPGRSIAYLLAWPGMDAESFLNPTRHPIKPAAREWLWAFLKTALGVVLLWIFARHIPPQHDLIRGWIGLFGIVFLLHFGGFHLIALFWQAVGIDAEPIMKKPILSRTLSEFWGKRWNLGFRQLAHDLVFRPLHRSLGVAAAGFLVFLASGAIHDLVISLPARGGYGLPTGYFVIQGLGVTLERSAFGRRSGLQQGPTAWLFLLTVTAVPAFWLFHPPFVRNVILPFMRAIGAL